MDAQQSTAGAQDPFDYGHKSNPYNMPYRSSQSGSLASGEQFFFTAEDLEQNAIKRSSTSKAAPSRSSGANSKHRRTSSTPARQASYASNMSTNTTMLMRSLSDANWKPTGATLACHSSGKRKTISPIRNSIAASTKLKPIKEDTTIEPNHRPYKLEALDPETGETILRSPMKKLFGESGFLGQATEPPSRKSHIISQLQTRARDMIDKLPNISFAPNNSVLPSNPSTFPVTLSPYAQGNFYMEMELLLTIEANRFILHEFHHSRVSTASITQIVSHWKNRGRPQVLGFRYDLSTQRDLVVLNMDTMHFTGVNAFNRQKLLSVLASWKVLAKEISVRTFCSPDSAVRKHLWDAEMVLELIDASGDAMMGFQEIRARVLSEIYEGERLGRAMSSRDRSRSPRKLGC